LISACLLGISVCPIWILALSNVEESKRGRDMGLVFFNWLAGLGGGMVAMNFLIGLFSEAAVYAMAGVYVFNLILFLILPGNHKSVDAGEDRPGASGELAKTIESETETSSRGRGGAGRLPLRETWEI